MNQFMRHCIVLPVSLIVGSSTGIFLPHLPELRVDAANVAQAPVRRYQPLPADTCNQLGQEMTNLLKVRVRMTRASFQDYISAEQGTGCQLTATGNGRDFPETADIVGNLSDMLTKQGWEEDSQYAADGPTGAGRGFRKENGLIVFNVEWEPASGVKCPEDQPISDCPLSPEQQIYRITLNGARK